MFEDIPRKIWLVTGYNIAQFFFVLAVYPSVILTLIGVALLTTIIFLIKKNKLALYLMLCWYAIQSVSITSPYLWFEFTYGFGYRLQVGIGSTVVTVYLIRIVMFVLLYVAKKQYFHAETVIERPPPREGEEDRSIREQLLASEPWTKIPGLNIAVDNGIVEIWGIVDSETERQALRVAAEKIPGVRAVTDRLILRKDVPGML